MLFNDPGYKADDSVFLGVNFVFIFSVITKTANCFSELKSVFVSSCGPQPAFSYHTYITKSMRRRKRDYSHSHHSRSFTPAIKICREHNKFVTHHLYFQSTINSVFDHRMIVSNHDPISEFIMGLFMTIN